MTSIKIVRPTAYTSYAQLEKMFRDPGQNYVMWGEPLPHHNDIPLYRENDLYRRITPGAVMGILRNWMLDRGIEFPGHETLAVVSRKIAALSEPKAEDMAIPGDIEPHKNREKSANIVRDGYDWIVSSDGRLAATVSGDHGIAVTHIVLKPEDIDRRAALPQDVRAEARSHATALATLSLFADGISSALAEQLRSTADFISKEMGIAG